MPKYLIERKIPGAHAMSPEELHRAANASCDVLEELGTRIQWQQSYVTEDTVTCVYIASDPEIVREHARRSGFPADRIQEIRGGMDPSTAEPRIGAAAGAG